MELQQREKLVESIKSKSGSGAEQVNQNAREESHPREAG